MQVGRFLRMLSINFESKFFHLMAKSACRQTLSRTIFIARWQMADGSWGERPGLPPCFDRIDRIVAYNWFFISRSRSQQKITGVTIRMHARLLNMPPMTGVASGFITSAPVR